MEQLIKQVEQWAIDRELEDKEPLKQMGKTEEEVSKLYLEEKNKENGDEQC